MNRTALITLLLPVAAVPVIAATSVPMRFHHTEAPVVMVRVQGQDLPLQLDLGDSSSLVLHPEVLASLHRVPTGANFKGFGMLGPVDTPIFRIEFIEIGGRKIRGVSAREDVHDDGFRKFKRTEVGALGFIGTGVFSEGQIRVDYPRRRFTFSLPSEGRGSKRLCRGTRIPFEWNQYGFTFGVDTDVGRLQLGWDTGTPVNLISRASATAVGLGPDVKSTQFKKLAVGQRDFGPQTIEIWDIPLPPEIAGLMGHPFFVGHVVCFDYAGSFMQIE